MAISKLSLNNSAAVVSAYPLAGSQTEAFAVTDVPWLTDKLFDIHFHIGVDGLGAWRGVEAGAGETASESRSMERRLGAEGVWAILKAGSGGARLNTGTSGIGGADADTGAAGGGAGGLCAIAKAGSWSMAGSAGTVKLLLHFGHFISCPAYCSGTVR